MKAKEPTHHTHTHTQTLKSSKIRIPQPRPHGIRGASTTYTSAWGNARSSIHWARPEIAPILVGTSWIHFSCATGGTPIFLIFLDFDSISWFSFNLSDYSKHLPHQDAFSIPLSSLFYNCLFLSFMFSLYEISFRAVALTLIFALNSQLPFDLSLYLPANHHPIWMLHYQLKLSMTQIIHVSWI